MTTRWKRKAELCEGNVRKELPRARFGCLTDPGWTSEHRRLWQWAHRSGVSHSFLRSTPRSISHVGNV